MTSDSVIATRQLNKQVFSGEAPLQLLDSIDLDIKGGATVAITGSSGSGKSTLLGLLAGLDTPSSGSVQLLGEEISSLDEDQRARLRAGRVGFVFQSFQLMPGLTALENVALPLELGDAGADATEQARTMLSLVGLKERVHHFPSQLSGGEQQRVALARAFVIQPQVLFADEPTGNLDSKNGEHVIELMFRLHEQHNTTLVLVTHDPQLALRCQKQLQLEAGRLVSS